MFKLFNHAKPTETLPQTPPGPAEEPPVTAEPGVEPGPQPTTAPEAVLPAQPNYPPLPPQPKGKGVLYALFSPETAAGRFMRPFLRTLGLITGFFALGLLAGYLLVYQPTQRELDSALLKIKQADQSASQKDQTLQSAQTDRVQAQNILGQTQADLKKAASENSLLTVLVSISNARVALVLKDGPLAKTAIETAQTNLTAALPFIESQDKTKSEVLKTRLDLAAKELVSDPSAAQLDLDKLSADLTDLHNKLFK